MNNGDNRREFMLKSSLLYNVCVKCSKPKFISLQFQIVTRLSTHTCFRSSPRKVPGGCGERYRAGWDVAQEALLRFLAVLARASTHGTLLDLVPINQQRHGSNVRGASKKMKGCCLQLIGELVPKCGSEAA